MAFSLLSNYKEYDCIIKSRLDIEILDDVQTQIEILHKNDSVKIISSWDAFAIGKPDIMKEYLNIAFKYGTYNFCNSNRDFKKNIISIEKYSLLKKYKIEWMYAPEIQLFECLFEYCYNNNYVIDTAILAVNLMVSIVRYDNNNRVFTKQIFDM